MSESSDAQKLSFIKKHAAEVSPLIDTDTEPALRTELERITTSSDEELERDSFNPSDRELLEKYETKLFVFEKEGGRFEPDAQSVLWAVSNPAYFNPGLFSALQRDRRCRSIMLLADNVAGQSYEKLINSEKNASGGRMVVADPGKPESLLQQLATELEKHPADIALAAFESENSPSASLLFGAKSTFGARKLYVLKAAWSGPGGRRDLLDRAENLEHFDAIICGDEVARRVTELELPGFPRDKILVAGSVGIDGLDIQHAAEHEEKGREKLGLSDDEIAILYVGLPNLDYTKYRSRIDSHVNEKTFERTITALRELAYTEPDRKFAALVRPHPRDGSRTLLEKRPELPSNLRIIPATSDIVTMNEAAYASDIIVSVSSNESMFAPSRGKPTVFLGYRDRGLGGDILREAYGEDVLALYAKVPGVHIVDSLAALKNVVHSYRREERIRPEQLQPPEGSSGERIANIIFSGR